MTTRSLEHLLPEGLEDDFGHWLAGFIDGEGCFTIIQDKRTGWIYCRFHLGIRADDRPIIDEAVKRTNCGTVYWRNPPSKPVTECPIVLWEVRPYADCLRLVAILDRYPLRAKKARDFAIWREATIEWCQGRRERLPEYQRALKETRHFRADDGGPPVVAPDCQEVLFGEAA